MKVIKLYFYSCLALLLALGQSHEAVARPLDEKPLDGLWKGPLQMPGGKLEVIFRLVKLSNGEYFATLDVPLQKVSRLKVTVTMRADTVVLTSTEANATYVGRLATDGSQLQGSWLQPGFKVPMVLSHSEVQAATAVATPRLTPPYREEEVRFSNTDAKLQLAGTLTVPAGAGPFPAVVLLSDAGPHDRNGTAGDFAPLSRLADYLTRRGIAVLRFDDRGVGQSTGDIQPTIEELASDAQAGLSYMRTRPEVKLSNLGLIGHGEGGNVALLTATMPEPPTFVVGLAPYALPGSVILAQQQEIALRSLHADQAQITESINRQQEMFKIIRQTKDNGQAQAILANMMQQSNANLDPAAAKASAADMVSARYRHFLSFNPLESLPQIACPVLLLYGTADDMLNVETNAAMLTRALRNNKGVTTHKFTGVNHLFQPDRTQWPLLNGEPKPNFSPAASDAVRAWITEQVVK
ncbi:alpha/beta hydrolase [Hymenobacter setariae]|uniref:Alpha/beta hydrolase n=1 Tax=Hymenobacter setariae TaxID=2594794 RepID=A0A558BVM3_9BACT|nr:alpha/beta hydrolase [Hymenobacter setariae]TVT40561.1 alpha/beta hydrolase [Hymenobacter setariae]